MNDCQRCERLEEALRRIANCPFTDGLVDPHLKGIACAALTKDAAPAPTSDCNCGNQAYGGPLPRLPTELDAIIDTYLRAKAEQIGQTQLAKFIGTKRQGVNAIINNKPGCRFTLDHLDRFVANTGARTSRVFMELARLASELDATPLTIKMTVSAEKVTHPAKE